MSRSGEFRPREANGWIRISTVVGRAPISGGGIQNPPDVARESPALSTACASTYPTPIRHVITIFMEDQNISNVLAGGSFERYLTTKYAEASQFYGLTSDSLANYRDAASGLDSDGSATTKNVPTLVDQVGESWAACEERRLTPCPSLSRPTPPTQPWIRVAPRRVETGTRGFLPSTPHGWPTQCRPADLTLRDSSQKSPPIAIAAGRW
ncbi:MAG: hypothetical protein WA549_00050 [Thermoplasmata archaeon]